MLRWFEMFQVPTPEEMALFGNCIMLSRDREAGFTNK